ncbi:FAD-binding oxidoreductase [Ruegeria pomeroyi]|uniref:FAD-binding oxidoreductase n=1 Tax=Ruegeria pomeroyi TaxID=89184 RepID=A0A9Q3WPZ9_9RHOB|nr:FAD-dependent oxidoreductase [Ruegeria pomeroyi]MCE8539994.1 FAD-binding oxidoreductase [Ruegeria pomeroyi]
MSLGCDFAVIGAGIAGASVAAELAASGRVVLIEQESQPGYHTTGRSAAVYAPIYGPQPIRALTRASLGFFRTPPQGFAAQNLLTPIAAAFVAREDQRASLDAMEHELADASTLTRIGAEDLRARLPLMRDGYAIGALWDNGTSEIDVAALHQGYLRRFKASGGTLLTRAPVTALEKAGGGWRIEAGTSEVTARIVINAAGAWADEVGSLAGAECIGLVPKRRSALMIAAPQGCDVHGLPLVVDVDEQFYLKPDAGKLLVSPANEDPEPPCDVQPDEMDIAICVDRIERAFDVSVRRIENSWAGLRSFVADKCPVVGFSRQVESFYWLAGQGGYGIQSAPALGQLAAAEVTGQGIPAHIEAENLKPDSIRPWREGIGA